MIYYTLHIRHYTLCVLKSHQAMYVPSIEDPESKPGNLLSKASRILKLQAVYLLRIGVLKSYHSLCCL